MAHKEFKKLDIKFVAGER